MTFEAFFIKKKIDLSALESGDTALFAEFKRHYALMGEKSFDHSKKYWFNKLRKQYALPENVQAVDTGVDAPVDLNGNKKIAAKESPQAVKPVGFKPRFKAANASAQTIEKKEDQAPTPPTGFKPMFKAGVVKKAAEAPNATDQTNKQETGQPKKDSADKPGDTHAEAPVKPKGFTPRFKAGVTKKADPTAPAPNTENPGPETKDETQITNEATRDVHLTPADDVGTPTSEHESSAEKKVDQPQDQAKPKPLGFKPRFKPKG